ncbi:MAG: hypothetical protein ACKO38_06575 [Planctomycetota bacterium]
MSFAMTRTLAVLALAAAHVGCGGAVRADDSITVIEFNKELDQLAVPRSLFGIFRDDRQTPQQQFIQEAYVSEKLPTGDQAGFLQLSYHLSNGTFNGFWIKTRQPDNPETESDWSECRKGALVLRVRKGKVCTNVFKVEVKTNNSKMVYPAIVRLANRQHAELEKHGYTDVVLPFAAFIDPRDPLKNVSELVVVLEGDRVTEKRGNLLIHSARLVKAVPR